MFLAAATRTAFSFLLAFVVANATSGVTAFSNPLTAPKAMHVSIRPDPASQAAAETLVWTDEFNDSKAQAQPNPANWVAESGHGKWGNHELQTYCAYGSNSSPCKADEPNVYVGRDGYLHIIARRTLNGDFTSARIKTEGLASFQYGRMEARIRIPSGKGMWPAFWMLGDSIQRIGWPKCGEFDIMENIGKEPLTIHGSIHGPGFTGTSLGMPYMTSGDVPWSQAFHIYGMIWSPEKVQYYVDRPSNVYATFTPASLPQGAVWPFDQGKFFFILNLAVGGDWPGVPDQTAKFPAEMLVDYVRVWQRSGATAKSVK